MSIKERIESEARACISITNANLVCKDCKKRFDDTERFGNTSKCEAFISKPNSVLKGGNCDEYIHE